MADLGKAEEVRGAFLDFIKYLYQAVGRGVAAVALSLSLEHGSLCQLPTFARTVKVVKNRGR
jgi:hypothetical protein